MSAQLTIEDLSDRPDTTASIRETFQIDTNETTPAFSLRTPHVPAIDPGYGPAEVDAMTTLIDWVEGGIAPERLPAQLTQDGTVKYQRAYCPYPQLTKHVGSGNVEDPKNYTCK